jgi:TetR/AcrR family transcriptional regulator
MATPRTVRPSARRRRPPAPPAAVVQVTSRQKLFDAATREFAARGFDGAKVDRIAAEAGVNKAMLYYHFPSKAALFRDVLIDMFQSTARAVRAVRDAGGPPEAQIRGFIQAFVREGQARPHFPPMWLREIAEGGRHLDETVFLNMRGVLMVLGEILAEGRSGGVFNASPLLLTQVGIVAPLLFFMCSSRTRQHFAKVIPTEMMAPTLETIVEHVERMTLMALGVDVGPARRVTKRSKR